PREPRGLRQGAPLADPRARAPHDRARRQLAARSRRVLLRRAAARAAPRAQDAGPRGRRVRVGSQGGQALPPAADPRVDRPRRRDRAQRSAAAVVPRRDPRRDRSARGQGAPAARSVMTRELRDADEVASWLAGGLALRRIAPIDAPALVEARPPGFDDGVVADAIRACANELPALPPAGVIADVALLLAGARPVFRAANPDDDALRTALVAYDDDVLVRLAATPRFDDVLAACAHAAAGDRPAAVALVVGAVCERARFAGDSVSPAALRRALAGLRDERARLA